MLQASLKLAALVTAILAAAAIVSCTGQQRRQIVSDESALMSSAGRAASRQRSLASARAINYGHLYSAGHRSARSFDMGLTDEAPTKRRSSKGRKLRTGARALSSSAARKSRARSAKLSKARAMAAAAKRSQARSMRFRRAPILQDELNSYDEFDQVDDRHNQQQAKLSPRSFEFDFGTSPKSSSCDCKCPEQNNERASEANSAEPKPESRRETKAGQLELPMSVAGVVNTTVRNSQELQQSEEQPAAEQGELKLSSGQPQTQQERADTSADTQVAPQASDGATLSVSNGSSSPKAAGLSLSGSGETPSSSAQGPSDQKNSIGLQVGQSSGSAQPEQQSASTARPSINDSNQRSDGRQADLNPLGVLNSFFDNSPDKKSDTKSLGGQEADVNLQRKGEDLDQNEPLKSNAQTGPERAAEPDDNPSENQTTTSAGALTSGDQSQVRGEATSSEAPGDSSNEGRLSVSLGGDSSSKKDQAAVSSGGDEPGSEPQPLEKFSSTSRLVSNQEAPAKASVESTQTNDKDSRSASGSTQETEPTVSANLSAGNANPPPESTSQSQRGQSDAKEDNKAQGNVQLSSASSPAASLSVSSRDDTDQAKSTPPSESSRKSSSNSDQSARTSDLLADKLDLDAELVEEIENKKAKLIDGLIEAKRKKFQPAPEPKPEPSPKPEPEPEPEYDEIEAKKPEAPVYKSKPRPPSRRPARPAVKQVYKSAPYPYKNELPPKCRAKVDELAHELQEVESIVEALGRKVFADLSLGYTTREHLSRKLARVRASADESLMAASLGKLRILNEAAKSTGVEIIRLSHNKVAQRFEPSLKRLAAKLRRVYAQYRKSCKQPNGS